MTAVSPGLQKALIAATARAPSAHNTQPAVWRFLDNGCIELLEDRTRLLPCADPLESDHRLALGIAYEGLSLAASTHGRILEEPSFVCDPEALALAGGRYRPVARTRVAGTRTADPLAEWVHTRATWRGRFVQPSRQRLRELISTLDHRCDLRLITRSRDLRAFGGLHDRCASELLARLGHPEELWRWLRLSPDHPGRPRRRKRRDPGMCSALRAKPHWWDRLAHRTGDPRDMTHTRGWPSPPRNPGDR